MKIILLTIIMLVTFKLGNSELKKSQMIEAECPVFKQILKNNPNVDKAMARNLARLVKRYAKIHKMNAYRAIAVAMQESGYRNIVTKRNGKPFDLGMFQINFRTVKSFKLDSKRIINDLEYSVNSYFTVMKQKERECRKLKNEAWSCYHSKNPSLRKNYKKLVNRYYAVAINEKRN